MLGVEGQQPRPSKRDDEHPFRCIELSRQPHRATRSNPLRRRQSIGVELSVAPTRVRWVDRPGQEALGDANHLGHHEPSLVRKQLLLNERREQNNAPVTAILDDFLKRRLAVLLSELGVHVETQVPARSDFVNASSMLGDALEHATNLVGEARNFVDATDIQVITKPPQELTTIESNHLLVTTDVFHEAIGDVLDLSDAKRRLEVTGLHRKRDPQLNQLFNSRLKTPARLALKLTNSLRRRISHLGCDAP